MQMVQGIKRMEECPKDLFMAYKNIDIKLSRPALECSCTENGLKLLIIGHYNSVTNYPNIIIHIGQLIVQPLWQDDRHERKFDKSIIFFQRIYYW